MTGADGDRLETVRFKGIGVSPGVAIGTAYVLARDQVRVVERELPRAQIEPEVCRLERAMIETRRQLRTIQRDLDSKTTVGDASILDAHLMVLDDHSFVDEVVAEIRRASRNAEAAVRNASERYTAILGSVDDDYLRERVADIRDVARRIIRNLGGGGEAVLPEGDEPYILVSEDLAPSLTATLRRGVVLGIMTDHGSATSHTAVMARAMEIPAVLGLRDASGRIETGDRICMDGTRGVAILRPSDAELAEYGELAETRKSISMNLGRLHDEPALTRDGRRVVLSANAESPDEVEAVKRYGAEGIGLFRSEYLYLARGAELSEEEQTAIYSDVASRLAPAPVILRTMDIGGDKFFPGERPRKEANPFLGCRSIRLSLLYPEHFKRQLRAMLRASASRNVKIMYPMVCSAREIIQANGLLEEAKTELRREGAAFDAQIEVGVMIETPAAALTAALIAPHARFFSIGTNDLVQYTLAVDRGNERVAYLYEPTHPAVLKLIKMTVEAGHAAGIWVGLCGEVAADPVLTGLLVGLGLDELSVSPAAVPVVKDVIRNMHEARAVELVAKALGCKTAAEVLTLCRAFTREVAPELNQLM